MAVEIKKSNKVKFKYIFADDFNPKYVNGAYGGLTPQGELVVNFFFERTALPYSQTYEIGPSGEVGKKIEEKPLTEHPQIVRIIENGIILNREGAERIYKWLANKISEFDKVESGRSDANVSKH